LFPGVVTRAQTPAGGVPKTPTRGGTSARPTGRGAAGESSTRVDANLLQLMRGILYPSSNVIFAAQEDFGKQTPGRNPNDQQTGQKGAGQKNQQGGLGNEEDDDYGKGGSGQMGRTPQGGQNR